MNVQVFKSFRAPESGFAPMLYIPNGTTDVSFYEKAFGATETRRFGNSDGSIHVSEFVIEESMFHLHEVTKNAKALDPGATGGHTTVEIGLFVADVHAVVEKAVAAGATITSAVQDYDYGYRQATIKDPFGHLWTIQQAI
ncbi:VOC family protein [Sediminibacterium roseum]|uniref:VOC family protein n=1 Tax=Sediminibacterium roseum TaxID=1978412 RepID=A0ABW9ZX63_9BACT|nr:VOC family protein [Sediminibacterium roseum]NCI50307.1 VOC family protein [Sediminibacterium roseum]